jgi:uroporphyrinogen-III decarboxylase
MSPEVAATLAAPDVLNAEPMLSLTHQMDYLEAKYGSVEPDINTTGVLNLLLDVRGNDLYIDMYEGPELVEHLAAVATEAVAALAGYLRRRGSRGPYMHPNCANVHLSPAAYRRFLRPADVRLSADLQPFGIHQCANTDSLIDAYATVPNVRHVDVQATTDRRLLTTAFPETALTVTLSPILMRWGRPRQISDAVREIANDLWPRSSLTIAAPALEHGTPDRNVRAFMQAVEQVG